LVAPTDTNIESDQVTPIVDDHRSTIGSDWKERVRKASTHTLLLLLVWLSGWIGLSFAWTLLVLLLYHIRRLHRSRSQQRRQAGQQLSCDEKAVIERTIGQLPSWVYFPDAERVEWLNKVVVLLPRTSPFDIAIESDPCLVLSLSNCDGADDQTAVAFYRFVCPEDVA
jgi:hypothetical protein